MTLREAGERLGVSAKRVQKLIEGKQLPARLVETPVGTRYQMVRRADVEALARERLAAAEGRSEVKRPGPKPRLPKGTAGGEGA